MDINLNAVHKALAENCLTWKDLSKLTGISTTSLARINGNSQKPQPITIGRIARALNLSIDEITMSEK